MKGGIQSSVYRPLQKMIPFEIVTMDEEISDSDKNTEQNNTPEIELTANEATGSRRSTRKAAIEGENLWRIRKQYS